MENIFRMVGGCIAALRKARGRPPACSLRGCLARASLREMHRLAAKALTDEERYRPLWEIPACRAVLEKSMTS